jgi:hypothetical protein
MRASASSGKRIAIKEILLNASVVDPVVSGQIRNFLAWLDIPDPDTELLFDKEVCFSFAHFSSKWSN